jgi:hypothetical protein
MNKIKIGIVFICVGRYDVFWNTFIETAEKYLFTNKDKYEKHYMVVTTNNIHIPDNVSNIQIKKDVAYKYPLSILYKFKYILLFENEMKNMDYVYYFNANAVFCDYVDDDILPNSMDEFVIAGHPVYNDGKHDYKKRYENREISTAYIDRKDKRAKYYCMSGIFGATPDILIPMSKEINTNIDIDLKNNIIAIWHDESHLNKWLLSHKYRVLPAEYCYMENCKKLITIKNNIKILILNKDRFGGIRYVKQIDNKPLGRKFF